MGALRAYQMMQDASFQKVITCSTFNKLIQSASLTEGLQSAFKVVIPWSFNDIHREDIQTVKLSIPCDYHSLHLSVTMTTSKLHF